MTVNIIQMIHLRRQWQPLCRKRQRAKVAGNTIDKVVEQRLFFYLKTFEQFISQSGQILSNLNSCTGVKIQGAPYMTYNEAVEWIGKQKAVLLPVKLATFNFAKTNRKYP